MYHASPFVVATKDEEGLIEVEEDGLEEDLGDYMARTTPARAPELSSPPPPGAPQQRGRGSFLSRFRRSSKPTAPPAPPAPKPPRASSARRVNKRVLSQRVDTNLVCIRLNALSDKDGFDCATGDPVFCSNIQCKSVFSHLSELAGEPNDDDERLWKCEFCGNNNKVDIVDDEIPRKEAMDYLLEPAVVKNQDDDSTTVFVCDVSGSMCVTQEVQGQFELKGGAKDEFAGLLQAGDERAYGNRRTTYVSRLQAVQAAIDKQLTQLQKDQPNAKVALVAFASDVVILGDGTQDQLVVTGDKLSNRERLEKVGREYGLGQPISQSHEKLTKKVWELDPKGQTALGPAMVIAVALAAQKGGSKVLICTDGLANVGLGSLEEASKGAQTNNDKDVEEEDLYADIGRVAAEAGVIVNVISITDSQCSLENLGTVADLTGGTVQRIDPLELVNNFNGILSQPVIATNVQAAMLLHQNLMFRDHVDQTAAPKKEENKEEENKDNENLLVARSVKDIGNAMGDTEVFFEYQICNGVQVEAMAGQSLPFQVQIHYSRLDGSKCVRVITQSKPVTMDQTQACKAMDASIVAASSAQKCANLAQAGKYSASRACMRANTKWLGMNAVHSAQQVTTSSAYVGNMRSFDNMVHELQAGEDDDEGSSSEDEGAGRHKSAVTFRKTTRKVAAKKGKKMKARSQRRGDAVSEKMYALKRASPSSFM